VLLGQLLVGILSAGLSNAGENQAREALASSEAFNRGILQSSGDRIEVLFLDGRIETINQAGLALQGLETDSAIIGTNWVEGWPRESREDAAAAIAAAGAGQVGRLRGWGLSPARPAMETATGTAREWRRWWDVVVTPIPGADGEPRRLLSMARDMTELQDARERTELALQAGAVMGIVTWEAGILSVDDRLARAFELSGEAAWQDIAPAEFLARVHPEDRDTLCDLGRRSLLTKSELRAPFRLRVQGERSGVWRWVEARGLVTGGANGRLVRLTGVLIDIDARKRAELELAQNEENVRQIADSLPILIAFISPELTYRFANRAYGDWFGKEPGRIVGRPIRRLLGEPIEEGPRLPLERALAGQATRFDAQIRHRNGSLRDVEIGYVPRRGGDGEVDGCYVIGIDITRRKEEERALSRSNLTLEHSLAMVQQESEQVWRLSRDLLCVLDSDGSLRSFNPAWVAALGWSGEDLLRRRHP
jgi:PAS domain S-box-containing protein